MGKRIVLLIVSLVFLWNAGCAALSPVEPTSSPAGMYSAQDDGHLLWGYFHLYIDPSIPGVQAIPARQVLAHFNVKAYVTPPACDDCIIVTPTGPFKDHILPIDVTLKNPTQLTGHDVRGILISNDVGATLKNPDNYTDLFDDGGAITINPFTAYAKAVMNRIFGPGQSFTESYQIYLSSYGKIATIDYAIDASWPNRAKEPYQISALANDGWLDNYGVNSAVFSVDVLAANNDVDEVLMDASSLGFTPDLVMVNTSGTTWKIEMTNSNLVPKGDYTVLIKASTSSSPKYLYSYETIQVYQGVVQVSLAKEVQPMFDLFCISCHQSVAPPEGLDLTEGNTYSNTVNVDSNQSSYKRIKPGSAFESYLVAKLFGMQLDPPYNGSGFQMPKTGGPLIDEQIMVITTWISQGAKDN